MGPMGLDLAVSFLYKRWHDIRGNRLLSPMYPCRRPPIRTAWITELEATFKRHSRQSCEVSRAGRVSERAKVLIHVAAARKLAIGDSVDRRAEGDYTSVGHHI